jgi:alkanesulfonate monooxygenase SsuD/methylene tetrahydromethanopterin reductase-like flavin-dependent oxidoreductase (luciferase family)
VALDGAGWHPAAWREPSARPADLFTAGYWADLARMAERGLLDFLTIEDSLALQSRRAAFQDGTDQVRGRLDAVMVAARVAPLTTRIGLVPSVTVTHTEPFHISKAIATLDYVSEGRAGVRVQVSARPYEARHFGRRSFPMDLANDDPAARELPAADLFAEASDYVEVLRRLWDSWEDDAEIRDVSTGKFIDREKLHYIDFRGPWFAVKGPSITPRPPQGQPLVAALAHSTGPYRFALASADVVFVTPQDADGARDIAAELSGLALETGRSASEVTVLADVVVFLGSTAAEAGSRKVRLDELFGRTYRSDAATFVGTPVELADLLEDWSEGGVQGFRLRPGGLPHDLKLICEGLVPELQRRSLFRTAYDSGTLRSRFGRSRPTSRYTLAEVAR